MARFELAAVDTALKSARHRGPGREVEYRVIGNPGLIFVVQQSGKRSWRFYYSLGTGTQRRKRKVSLGRYPMIGLATARAKAAALSVRVESEGDVVDAERHCFASQQKAALTFADFFSEYVTLRSDLVRINEIKREISIDVLPALGAKPPSLISAADIDAVGTSIMARSVGSKSERMHHSCESVTELHPKKRLANSVAYRMVMHMKTMFNYAIIVRPALAEKYGIDRNPAAMLGRRRRGSKSESAAVYAKPKPRMRVLLDDEIRGWASKLSASAMRADTKLALKLVLVTAQRPGEVRRAARSELCLSGAKPVWVIPPEHSKNGAEHHVPLSPLAVRLFEEAIRISKSDELVFPSSQRPNQPISNVVLPTAQANLFRKKLPNMKPATAHDLRRTAATGMRRLRVDRDTVGMILNHTPTGVTARHYDHHEGEEEKREALNAWGSHLCNLCEGGSALIHSKNSSAPGVED